MIIVKPFAEFITITPDAEKLIEKAGRCCYKSEDAITEESAAPFVHKICNVHKHESVLEHASATFRFVVDRGVTHELVRHRIASFSQESTRYCNYSKDKFSNQISVIEPPTIREKEGAYEAWVIAMESAEKAYFAMLEAKCSPQIARSVLPTCLKTEIYTTANLREWMHIFKMRCSSKAHPQIQEVMNQALDVMRVKVPSIFADLKPL